ncbi:response regulator [Nocardioides ungokensis]|uniref:response regulator n=1 Tax=Nocardioides ungokensis TaxID=1643322 RepID=UPI0015DFDFB5|nr:response regulator transcription factor [Nocardioides ungokensis]
MPLRVLVCDDQALVRAGFAKLLEATDGFEVVGGASNGAEAVDQARRLLPDVVLMDVRMPVLDGISATSRIVAAHDSRVRVLVLTTFGTDDYVADALRAGASGFLLKDAPPDKLVEAVRVVARGDALLDPSVTRNVIAAAVRRGGRNRASRVLLRGLTQRETETLQLLARGLTNAEIADRLVVGEATVKTHVGHLFTKLDVRDRVQAVIFAYESGLVSVTEGD